MVAAANLLLFKFNLLLGKDLLELGKRLVLRLWRSTRDTERVTEKTLFLH